MDMKKSKYLYARAEAALVNDDDQTSSICIPTELFRGARYGGSSFLILDIGNPKQYAPTDALDTGSILLEINSNAHTTVFESLSKAIATGEEECIIIGDDATSEYLSGVVSVLSINVNIS